MSRVNDSRRRFLGRSEVVPATVTAAVQPAATLLLAILVLCIPLAWVGARLRSTREQQHVLAKLERFGPGIVLAQGNVKLLSLGSTEVTDRELRDVGRLAYLERLDLESTRITDAGLPCLSPLKRLRFLSLSMTNTTDAGLAALRGLHGSRRPAAGRHADYRYGSGTPRRIDEPAVVGPGADEGGGRGAFRLGRLTNLRRLYIRQTLVTDAGLDHLRPFSGLQFLALNHTRVTDDGLAKLGFLQQLETLWLHHTEITDIGLAHLAALRNLKQLELAETQVTEDGIARLERQLPHLRVLH